MAEYLSKTLDFNIGKKMTLTPNAENISDNDLIALVIQGQKSGFKELVSRYQKQAFLFAKGMVGNHEDAYDLSQEAFIRAYKYRKRFNPAYTFRTWFFHILANLCKNHLRKRRNRESVVTSSELTSLAKAPPKNSPDILFEKNETHERIWEAIALLPEKFKEIIILNHFQEMSYDQIASILNIPRGSVMSRLYYARIKLKEILEQRGISL